MSELKKTQGFKIIQSKNEILKQFLVITLGTLIVSIGVYFFKFPNHFATGGVTGMAVLLQQLLGISQGMITTILNLVLLVLGFLIFGKSFGFKTAYSTVLLSENIADIYWYLPAYCNISHKKSARYRFVDHWC